jgi:hypothetical protein
LPRAVTTNPPGAKCVAGTHRTILLWQKLHPETAKSPLFPYILFTSRRDPSVQQRLAAQQSGS